jgi:hypothetical protein
MGNFASTKIRAWSAQNVLFARRKPPKRLPPASTPTARLFFIFSTSSLLDDAFQDMRAWYPELLEGDALVRFVSVLFVLLQERGSANGELIPEMKVDRMRNRLRKALQRLRAPRLVTVDMLVHSHDSIERTVREENLNARFNLAWKEATGQPIHRDRTELRLDRWQNRLLAQAVCRTLIALGY